MRCACQATLRLLVKACVTLEGFGRLIDPDFQLMEEAAPLLKKTLVNALLPQNAGKIIPGAGAMDAVERLYNPCRAHFRCAG
jgi:ubiquinone biosynthesis protein